jgi:hypothetical protein
VVPLALQVLKEPLDHKDWQVPQVPQAYMEAQDHKDHKAQQVLRAYKATLEPLVNKDLMAPPDLMVPLEYRALMEPQVPLDLKVLQVSQEI